MGGGVYGRGVYGSGPYGGGYTQANEFSGSQAGPIVLAEIDFEDVTKYVAMGTARFADKMYDGTIVQLGQIQRVMQKNLGLFESSAVTIILNNTDQAFSILARPIKGAAARIKVGTDRMQLADYQTILGGRIDNYSIDGFTLSLVIKDSLFNLPEFPTVGTVNETDFPNSYPDHRGEPLPLCYGTHSVTSSDDARNRGAWPTLYIDNRSGFKKFLVARHPVFDIAEVYATLPGSGSTLLIEGTDYTAVTSGTINGEDMAYIEFSDAQFNANLFDANGTLAVVTCNVSGRMDIFNDLITNPITALIDFLETYCGDPDTDLTKMDEAFDVCVNRSYAVRGGYTQRISTAQVLSQIAKSFNIRLFPSKLGAISADILDPDPLGTNTRLFDEGRDILENSWSIDHDSQVEGAEDAQVVNKVEYLTDFHHAKQKFFSSSTVENADSIALYEEKNLQIEMPWATETTGTDVAQRILFQFKDPVPHANFQTGIQGLLIDISEQITASHQDGDAGAAWVGKRLEAISLAFDPATLRCTIRGIDVAALTEQGFFLDDETRRQRVANGTVAVTNGSADINATGATSFITAGVAVGDIIRLKTVTNEANRKNLKITAIVDADTVQTAQTVWVNESGITYEIVRSWLTKDTGQEDYGHLADETTGEFSNGDEGFVFL
jgi:hypothetical protein